MVTVKEALKDSTDVRYARVSTRKQTETLPTQVKDINSKLKQLGHSKKGTTFTEQGSGTKHDRAQLIAAINMAVEQAKKGKKMVFVVRDIQRFSRSALDFGHLYKFTPSIEESLWFNDVPIVALNDNLVVGTKNVPSANDTLIGSILVSIGGQEVDIRLDQTKAGQKAAAEQGIVQGVAQNLYYESDPNPVRAFYDMFYKMEIPQGKAALALGRSRSWGKDLKNKINGIIIEGEKIGNKNLIEDYLDTTDLIREYEKEFGPRTGRLANKRMIALGRKTSGYLKFPWRYPKPTREMLDEYRENFKDYLPKRASN
ncbi:recombinase family protein [Candidatus Poseidoniaceae archaeon]|nr:recombinase family protein [Candidatus Poseidoniaceae archaeon]